MAEYSPLPKINHRPRRQARYTRMTNGYGYICPKCREVIMRDRVEDTYFCVHAECEFKETREEYKLTLRDIRLTHEREKALGKARHEADRQARIAARRQLPSVVYYIRFRDTIKIGTTVDLKTRMTAHPYEEVVALEPGAEALERARHLQFDKHRILGEWFLAHDELEEHMKEIQDRNAEWVERQYGMARLPWDRSYFLSECPTAV